MGFGLSVVGDSGSVQIDSTYKNLALIKSGSVVLTFGNTEAVGMGGTSSNGPRVIITCTGVNPIIAVKSGFLTRTYRRSLGSGSFEFHILFGDVIGTGAAGISTPVDYYIFDEPPVVASTYGLKVFGASSEVIFDSTLKYLKVLSQISGTASPWPLPGSISGTEHVHTFSHGNLAVVTCQQAARLVVGIYEVMGSTFYESFVASSRSFVRGNDVVISNAQEMASPGGVTSGEQFRRDLWNFLVVDVTGCPIGYDLSA